MCLILFAWNPAARDQPRLVVAANRDEFFHRAAARLGQWPGRAQILAGQDLGAEPGPTGLPGTWMGCTLGGRFAALTNFRDPRERQTNAASRGQLVTGFLAGDMPCAEYLLDVQGRAGRFNGFNLLVGDVWAPQPQLWWYSNRAGRPPVKLGAGIYGVSNALLDTPWPKLTRGVAGLSCLLAAQADDARYFDLLGERKLAPDHELPNTGVPLEWERRLSALFVDHNGYGTRASQLLRIEANGRLQYRERCFDPTIAPDARDLSLERVASI